MRLAFQTTVVDATHTFSSMEEMSPTCVRMYLKHVLMDQPLLPVYPVLVWAHPVQLFWALGVYLITAEGAISNISMVMGWTLPSSAVKVSSVINVDFFVKNLTYEWGGIPYFFVLFMTS